MASETDIADRGLPDLLNAAAGELDTLARTSHRLHELVERQLALAGLAAKSIEDAQLIDYLSQHLEALALFLRLLAEQAPQGAGVDADPILRRINLADLARRLAGGPPPDSAAPGGDLELF